MSHHVCISDVGEIIRCSGNLCEQIATGHTMSGVPGLSSEQAAKAEAKGKQEVSVEPGGQS